MKICWKITPYNMRRVAIRALQIALFTTGAACFFIIHSFHHYDLKEIVEEANSTNVGTYIEVQQTKTYPKYYESNLNMAWPFNITRQYSESDIQEWREPTVSQNKTGIGEGGAGFVPPDNLKELMERLYEENNYNLLASDMISLRRSLPDPRYSECKNLSYPTKLPTTSVIIVFHNEAWTTLLRTVWSVIDRSPVELIREIILVDDLSTWSFLKRPLDDYIERIPVPIKLIRNTKREGLIRARLIGARQATGQVLTFLDAHIECCVGWLQPLLARIASDRSVIAVPLSDDLSTEDMSYGYDKTTSINGFRMTLIFNWMPVPERELIRTHYDKTAPLRTPTMVGCAFSIDKDFFFEIGTYDEGMNIWGSENMEMSLRVWQCGGSLEILPCSHVGHLFRTSTYSFDGDADAIRARNNVRLLEVWMPEVRDILYAFDPRKKKHSGGDITERLALKRRLNCKDFRWYLEHVYPESTLNNELIHFGQIKSLSERLCLSAPSDEAGDKVELVTCCKKDGSQALGLTKAHKIVVGFQEMCIGVENHYLVSVNCEQAPRWSYDNKTNWMVHEDNQHCMKAKKRKIKLQ